MQCIFWYDLSVFASSKNQSFDWKTSLLPVIGQKPSLGEPGPAIDAAIFDFLVLPSSMVIGNLAKIEQDTPPHTLKTNMASWKISMFNRRYIFKSWLQFSIVMILSCYNVSFPGWKTTSWHVSYQLRPVDFSNLNLFQGSNSHPLDDDQQPGSLCCPSMGRKGVGHMPILKSSTRKTSYTVVSYVTKCPYLPLHSWLDFILT